MKTPDSTSDQKTTAIPGNSSMENSGENSSDNELRIADEKNMIGQPMGNRIQNSNFKHQTPLDKTNENNFSEGDSNQMKEQQQLQTPPINVIETIKNASANGKQINLP